ncbi:hypothetical protein BpHYR1_050747 [Brachionus plicatilis]|uniref:FLYWCH-type domain-containing protein n=1 Tax=Brachionus plicatilis TaxID=10195 RepID=A0A3M7Q120_BRAPC|nr:hypothetical protein BpHYR1_050747 [Brachionus plicatilis]
MNIFNSPFVSRLRSNKNYKPTTVVLKPSKPRQYKNNEPVNIANNNFNFLVEQICAKNIIDAEDDLEFLDAIDSDILSYETDEIQNLVEKIPKISLNEQIAVDDEAWYISYSHRGSNKLYSNGFCYVVDKPKRALVETATKIYWRCEHFNDCPGLGISKGLKPPFKETIPHNHLSRPEDKQKMISKNELKEIASTSNEPPRYLIRDFQLNMSEEIVSLLPKKDTMRRQIIRTRNSNAGYQKESKCLDKVEISQELTKTYKGVKFYYDDSGKTDKNRVIFFTTDQNLKLLSTYRDWYCDGTFDISPTLFECKIYGCFFHLCQAFWRRIQTTQTKTLKLWYSETFRKTFRLVQALAFIPVSDVGIGFEFIKKHAEKSASSFLQYVENNYVGTNLKNQDFH